MLLCEAIRQQMAAMRATARAAPPTLPILSDKLMAIPAILLLEELKVLTTLASHLVGLHG